MSQSLPRNLQRDHKVTQNNGAGGERCCEKGYGKVEAWGNRWSRAQLLDPPLPKLLAAEALSCPPHNIPSVPPLSFIQNSTRCLHRYPQGR